MAQAVQALGIKQVLAADPRGLSTGEVVERVLPLIKTTAENPKNPIYARLCKLKQAGDIAHDASANLYYPSKSK
jgi:hypothetical protein